MNIVSSVRGLAVLSLFAVGAIASEAAAESGGSPLVDHVRAMNDRFKEVSAGR